MLACRQFFIQINMLSGQIDVKIDNFLLSGVYSFFFRGLQFYPGEEASICHFSHCVHLSLCAHLMDKGEDLRQRLAWEKLGNVL